MLDRAEELAKGLIENTSDDSQRIHLAFERILFRPPTADEERWVSELLLENVADTQATDTQATEEASERLRRWTDICHALLNTNSFLYIE